MSGDEGEDYNGDSAPSNEGGADVIDADSELDEFPIEDEAGELADSSGLLLGQDEDEDELDEIDTYDEEVLEAQGTDEGALNHQPEPQGEGAAVPAAKIKRPSSAWMIYINEQRDRMRREYPGMSIGEVAKALSAEYKALAPEVAEKYLDLARKDKERYLEAKRNVPPVTLGTVNARGGSSEPIPPGELVFPLARIKKIMKIDPDVKNVQKEALSLLTKSVELFIGYAAARSARNATGRGAKTVKDTDFVAAIHSDEALDFLKSDFPLSIITKAAAARKAARSKRPINAAGDDADGTGSGEALKGSAEEAISSVDAVGSSKRYKAEVSNSKSSLLNYFGAAKKS